MPRASTFSRALCEIDRLPVDYGSDILANYPLLKLGTRGSIDYYGSTLVPLVREIIDETLHDVPDWVLTGPAFHILPGGPNLLCEYLVEHLRGNLRADARVAYVPLGVDTTNLEIKDKGSLHKYHNYSTFSREERKTAYGKARRPLVDPDAFRGRSIMFVNDIKVTGTQQTFMQEIFEEMAPKRICWLYILTVAPDIAQSRPEIEYDINHSRYATFEAFADLLSETDLRYTSRCVTRMLSYDVCQLERLASRLGRERTAEILDLAVSEGRFGGDLFKDKIDLLKHYAGREAVVLARAEAALPVAAKRGVP